MFFPIRALVFIFLSTASFIDARDVRPKNSVIQKQQQVQVQKPAVVSLSIPTFAELFIKIKTMPANQVVSGSSINAAFMKSIIENFNLSSLEMEALLQAAVSIYAVWSGDNIQDKEKLTLLTAQIANNVPQVKGLNLKQPIITLEAVLNGVLGEPYTSKANEIYNSGIDIYINDLNKRINIFNTGKNAANNIKKMIDTVYGFLTNYLKNNPLIKAAPQEGDQLITFEAVLSGALGEPYTSKAKEIYNSGVTQYIDDLKMGIDTFNTSEDAINDIRKDVDTVYDFFKNYLLNYPTSLPFQKGLRDIERPKTIIHNPYTE